MLLSKSLFSKSAFVVGAFTTLQIQKEKISFAEKHIETPTFCISQVSPTANAWKTLMKEEMMLIPGSVHKQLNEEISKILGVNLAKTSISRFADGEVNVIIDENVRGRHVFIIQSCGAPVNDNIIELLLTVAAVRRSSASRITAVVPYFGYKHHRRGMPISNLHDSRFLSSGAMDFAKMLTVLGVDRVIAVDLQRPGQGGEACFFDNAVPLESVVTTEMFINHFITNFKLNEANTVSFLFISHC